LSVTEFTATAFGATSTATVDVEFGRASITVTVLVPEFAT